MRNGTASGPGTRARAMPDGSATRPGDPGRPGQRSAGLIVTAEVTINSIRMLRASCSA